MNYTVEQINRIINSIQDKIFYLKHDVHDNGRLCSQLNIKKQVEESEIILDALNFYKEMGLGRNIDERV